MNNAWFKDHQGKTKRLARGEEMEIAAHHLELIDIIGEQVLVMIDGRPTTLGTGQSLPEDRVPLGRETSARFKNF